MVAKKKMNTRLDEKILGLMIEPLTVQVTRTEGGHPTPIALPEHGDYARGQGWTKELVREVDQGWLETWCGGGHYTITVTDSNLHDRKTYEWEQLFNSPSKNPPTHEDDNMGMLPTRASFGQPQRSAAESAPTGSVPSDRSTRSSSLDEIKAMVSHLMQDREASATKRLEEQLALMQAQLTESKLAEAKREYQVQLERQEAAHAQAIARLEARIAEANSNKPNQELEMMKAQLENERREREAERRDRDTREMLSQMQANMQRQMEAMQQGFRQQMEALQAAAANKGPDPMIQVMMEQNRTQAESTRELARQFTEQINRLQGTMMSPREILQLSKDASNGLDQVTQKMSSTYGNVLEMYQKVFENALQINAGGSETMGLVRDLAGGVQGLVDRYITGKGQAAQMQIQAQAMQAQQQAQLMRAQIAAAQGGAAQGGGLAGAPAQAAPAPAPKKPAEPPPSLDELRRRRDEADAKMQAEADARKDALNEQRARANGHKPNGAPAQPRPAQPDDGVTVLPLRHGKTDVDWFGPALPQVLQIRAAVAQFLSDLTHGKVAETGAATPENIAATIIQADQMITANQLEIPALVELLHEGEHDVFVEVLLPDVMEDYRADVVRGLSQVIEQLGGFDNGEDDGEYADDVRDGAVS